MRILLAGTSGGLLAGGMNLAGVSTVPALMIAFGLFFLAEMVIWELKP